MKIMLPHPRDPPYGNEIRRAMATYSARAHNYDYVLRHIIIDQGLENTPEERKSMYVGIKEGLLPLTWVKPHEVLA